ncbi:13575_t:CDS:2, partial [Cetraspora pellucida]
NTVYNEMEPFLPGIKREYLRKKTQKVRNIYTLFKEIGIDKIKQVMYSANAISRLMDTQVQNIIKVISMNNVHTHVTKPSSSKDISNIEKMLSKEMRNQVINKLTTHFIDSPKLDKNNSIDTEGEHQTDSYWVLGSYCPLYKENHMSLDEPGILYDDVLKAYSGNSELIQELKTRCFTSPIPWNYVLILPDKGIVAEA